MVHDVQERDREKEREREYGEFEKYAKVTLMENTFLQALQRVVTEHESLAYLGGLVRS